MSDTDVRLVTWAALAVTWTLFLIGERLNSDVWVFASLFPFFVNLIGSVILIYRQFTGGGGNP